MIDLLTPIIDFDELKIPEPVVNRCHELQSFHLPLLLLLLRVLRLNQLLEPFQWLPFHLSPTSFLVIQVVLVRPLVVFAVVVLELLLVVFVVIC